MKKLHSPDATSEVNSLGTETGTMTVGRRPGRPAGSSNGGAKRVGKISRRSVQKYTDKLGAKETSFRVEIDNNEKIIALYEKALDTLKAKGQDNPMMVKRIEKIRARNEYLNTEIIGVSQMLDIQNQILDLLPQAADDEDDSDDEDDDDEDLPE